MHIYITWGMGGAVEVGGGGGGGILGICLI